MRNYRIMFSFVLVMLFSLVVFTTTGFTAKAESANRVIIVFNDDMNDEATLQFNAMYQLTDTKALPGIHGQKAMVSGHNLKALKNDPKVKFVANDDVVSIAKAPTDSIKAQTLPWGIDAVNSEQVWSTYTGAGIKIAILDTGIDTDHPDLVDNIKGGINIINTRKTYEDDNGHGTHVAGTIAAVNNDIGVVGVAPEADLYAVKVLNRRGVGYASDIIAGIEWAVNNGVDIISMSLGSAYYNEAYEAAVDFAYNNGVIVVAATGNESTSVGYPAAYANAIAVGAVDDTNTIAYFSNYGPEVDVVAPGVNVASTYLDGQYAYGDGTSMATPHVTGVIALMMQAGNADSLEEVRTQFANHAIDLGDPGKDDYYGYGLVDASLLTQ